MKPASRIETTIDVLEKMTENTRVPMDRVVGDYMRVRRFIGAKDRREIAERIYDIARAHARLGWWLAREGLSDTPRHRVIAWLALGEGIEEKRFADLFDGSKHAPEPIDEDEHAFIRKILGKPILHADMPEDIAAECPPLYAEKLHAVFGKDFAREMEAMLAPATLDLRTNIFLAKREKAQKFLAADGIETTETPHSPWGLRCATKAYLSRTKAFTKGWVEIQDEGSQLIAHLCDVKPGMQVVDYCAGAGGKTLALAAAMYCKGRIVAMDNDQRRLKKGRERYKKAKLSDIIELRCIDDEKQRKWVKRQKQKFDVVLVDAPCSGTGTWRRNPDMRWRTYGPTLEDLIALQAEIIDKAATLVKPGGRLVYATCSLLNDENETQVERFLKDNEDFEILPVPQSLGAPFMRLTPHKHQTDGFFAAVLTRK